MKRKWIFLVLFVLMLILTQSAINKPAAHPTFIGLKIMRELPEEESLNASNVPSKDERFLNGILPVWYLSPDEGSITEAIQNEEVFLVLFLINPDRVTIRTIVLNDEIFLANQWEKLPGTDHMFMRFNVGNIVGEVEFSVDRITFVSGNSYDYVWMKGMKTQKITVVDSTADDNVVHSQEKRKAWTKDFVL